MDSQPSPARIVPYPGGRDIPASRAFYVEALGLEVTMEDPVLCLSSPANPSAAADLLAAGLRDPATELRRRPRRSGGGRRRPRRSPPARAAIVYPLTDEPWGVHRFFVEDPGGTIVNVLAHITERAGRRVDRAGLL